MHYRNLQIKSFLLNVHTMLTPISVYIQLNTMHVRRKKSGALRWVIFDTLGCLHGVFNLSYEPGHFL